MPLLAEYLIALERARSIDDRVVADDLRGHAEQFLMRRWVVADGHLTSIVVPVLDSEDEVEVVVDEENNTFSYCSPGQWRRTITRPLAEIAIYAFNVDAWLDDLTEVFQIETAHRARKRSAIDAHLWHIGNLRVGRTHQFAPLYVARRLAKCSCDWRKPLLDAVRPGQGIVLTALGIDVDLPNGHQQCELDDLLVTDADRTACCDRDMLDRLLGGVAADALDSDEWFNEKTGELKLSHMDAGRVFRGKQKAVIAAFWKARHQHSLKWADVMAMTNCGKDPGSTFGGAWAGWLENVGHGQGLYRLRTRRRPD